MLHLLQHKDILQLMVDATGEEEGSDDDEKEATPPAECPAHKATAATKTKTTMTDDEVVANSFGFLFAGNETTAITLSFASYELALHPDIQEKLQSEIDDYFEEKPVSCLGHHYQPRLLLCAILNYYPRTDYCRRLHSTRQPRRCLTSTMLCRKHSVFTLQL